MQFLQKRIHCLPPLCRWWRTAALARRDATTTLMPTSTYLDCLPLPQNRLSRFVLPPSIYMASEAMNHLPLSDVDFLSEEDRYCCNCVVIMIENIEINLNFFYCFNPDLFVL
jgi:hypothetical protein